MRSPNITTRTVAVAGMSVLLTTALAVPALAQSAGSPDAVATLSVQGGPSPRLDAMTFSPETRAGGDNAVLAVAANDGCVFTDYVGAALSIVVVERGGCTFAQKQEAAADAYAVGVLIYNNVDGPLRGTLGSETAGFVPTAGITRADGAALVELAGTTATLELRSGAE